jgi:hypothetical protein
LKKDLQLLRDEGVSLGAAMNTLANSEVTAETNAKALSQAVREVKEETQATTKSTFDLGNAAQRVFRSIIGFVVLNILRRLLDAYGELIEKGKAFADSIVDISIAVRKLQREGENITFREVTDEIARLREEFGLFTEKELNAGLSSLLILGNQLNLTKQQIFDIAEATAVAATVTGVNYKEAIDRVARALATGQTRGLVELNLAISEASIAEEAYRLGLAETGEALDRNTKAQALYSLIVKESNALNEDAIAIQDTLVGGLIVEEKSLEQISDEIGTKLLPTKKLLLSIINELIGAYFRLQERGQEFGITIIEFVARPVIGAVAIFQELQSVLDGTGFSLERLGKTFEGLSEQLDETLQGFFFPEEALALGDLPKGLQDTADETTTAGDELNDALQDLFIKLRESLIDGNQAVEKEGRRIADTLADIEAKLAQKLQELTAKLAFDRAKIWRDFNDKVADINAKARDRELDAERKFQDRMRSLRAKFLLDLEEAVQERDARQIIRLIKRFKLQQDELRRQRDSEFRDLADQRERELRDLRIQRDRRLRELDLEFAFRQQKLLAQAKFDADQAEIDSERRLREIQIATQQRNEELVRRFADEQELTKAFADNITRLLKNTFGPDGRIEAIYDYFLELTQAVFESLADSVNQLNRLNNFLNINPEARYTPPGAPGFAEGGTLIARRPTVAVFGEAGPERVDFTPLTRPGRNVGKVFGGQAPGTSTGQGRATLVVSLTPGLMAEMMNNTLGEMANIIVETNRQRL